MAFIFEEKESIIVSYWEKITIEKCIEKSTNVIFLYFYEDYVSKYVSFFIFNITSYTKLQYKFDNNII